MSADIKVSIICNTYNHENYIRDALEGFLMQKTNFAFEILIHDDASTDNTAKIIREYEEKYPQTIKPIYQKENQYSQGVPIGETYQHPRAKGKYIAFCEGDDYWTDEYKLQKQFDALELHPEVDMCAHTANMVQADTKKLIGKIQPALEDTILSIEKVIVGGGGFVSTNSIMCRTELLIKEKPSFRRFLRLDYTLQIQGSLRGGMLYLKDNMSNYRLMAKGSWTERMKKKPTAYVENYKKIEKMLQLLDEDTNYQYTGIIQKQKRRNHFFVLELLGEFKKMLLVENKEFLMEYPFKTRLKIRLKAYFPWLIKLKQKFKK